MTDFINPSESDKSISELIIELTRGLGVDYSFECTGVPSLITEALQATKLVSIFFSSLLLSLKYLIISWLRILSVYIMISWISGKRNVDSTWNSKCADCGHQFNGSLIW